MRDRTCNVNDCGKPHYCRGMCVAHYAAARKRGDFQPKPKAERGAPMAFVLAAAKSDTDDCILWPYGKAYGYGKVVYQGRGWQAHGLALMLASGRNGWAEGLDAAHNCGRPACVNPKHIRWATVRENMADKAIHGTQPRGELVPTSRLTASQVVAIRAELAAGERASDVARRYGLHSSHIHKIKYGTIWRHVGVG